MPVKMGNFQLERFAFLHPDMRAAFYLCDRSTRNRIESNQLARELRIFFRTDCLPSTINRLPRIPEISGNIGKYRENRENHAPIRGKTKQRNKARDISLAII